MTETPLTTHETLEALETLSEIATRADDPAVVIHWPDCPYADPASTTDCHCGCCDPVEV